MLRDRCLLIAENVGRLWAYSPIWDYPFVKTVAPGAFR
jgi:hypothetical protein